MHRLPLLVLVLTACGPTPLPPEVASTGDLDTTTAPPDSSTNTAPLTTTTTTTTAPPTTGDLDTSTTSDSAFIIAKPDDGRIIDCDIFAQDCPAGQKCMPWHRRLRHPWLASA